MGKKTDIAVCSFYSIFRWIIELYYTGISHFLFKWIEFLVIIEKNQHFV